MDPVGWYIVTMHQMLGHDVAAAAMGVPAGDKSQCVICDYEKTPTTENRKAVIAALRKQEEDHDQDLV